MGVATCRLAPYTSSTYISLMLTNKKPLEWIGSSHKNSMALPAVVRRLFGFALSLAQSGDKHDAAKVLKGFAGAEVYLRLEAAKRMGITQPKVSGMMRGDFTNLSERKLMDCLTRLGYDIEIKVRPAKAEVGHLMLAAA